MRVCGWMMAVFLSLWVGKAQESSGSITEDEAVRLAVERNAQLKADLAALGIARADVLDAGLLRNPTLGMLIPVGLKPFELLLNYPVEALWQRPKRRAAAQASYDHLARSLMQNGLNTARDAVPASALSCG